MNRYCAGVGFQLACDEVEEKLLKIAVRCWVEIDGNQFCFIFNPQEINAFYGSKNYRLTTRFIIRNLQLLFKYFCSHPVKIFSSLKLCKLEVGYSAVVNRKIIGYVDKMTKLECYLSEESVSGFLVMLANWHRLFIRRYGVLFNSRFMVPVIIGKTALNRKDIHALREKGVIMLDEFYLAVNKLLLQFDGSMYSTRVTN